MFGRVDFNYDVVNCCAMRHLEIVTDLVPSNFVTHVGWSFLVGGLSSKLAELLFLHGL